MMKSRLVTGVLAAGLLLCRFLPAAAEESRKYSLGIVPSAPPVTTYTLWAPFVERLSRETGLDFRLKVYEKMADFELDIIAPEGPDFIFVNSLQIVVAHQAQGYIPLVRGGGKVWAELFVRRDSPVKTVADLAGKRVAFVGSKNLCSVYIRHVMSGSNETMLFDKEYSGSGANVIRSVMLGKADAGATLSTELDKETPEVIEQIRSIEKTGKIPSHPLAAHPRVPRAVRAVVKNAVLTLAATPSGAELLRTLRLPAPEAADYEKDYRSLEVVDVKTLSSWGE
jgi:phosphonate transport system substrate-binding protein